MHSGSRNRFKASCYLLCRPVFRPLEHHMLEKMGNTVCRFGLVPGAGVNPDTDGNRFYVGNFLADNPNAVGKNSLLICSRDFFRRNFVDSVWHSIVDMVAKLKTVQI